MKWFKHLKIRVKLIICFIVLAALTGAVGVIGISNMGTINARSDAMYNNNFLPAQQLAEVQKNLLFIRSHYILMLYEKDVTKFQDRVDEIEALSTSNTNTLTEFEKAILSKEERALYENVNKNLMIYNDIRKAHIDLLKAEKFEEANLKINEFTKKREALDKSISSLIGFNENVAKENSELNTEEFNKQSTIMISIIILGVILALGLGFIISNIISNPINQLLGAAKKIADGDLDVSFNIQSKDEVGELAFAFGKMTDNLNEVMANINTAAEQVASGSKQVSDSSMALSQGATEQASSVEELTASLEEIASQTKQNSDSANQANSLAEVAKENAVEGNSQMKDMLKAMDEINDSSNSISKIIKVIDEIAFQTNILALNAAVEAARAGQHGKGFAVVAEEVRNLAARSANAAKETTEMIEGSIKKVEGGTKIANLTAVALNKIVGDVTSVANLVGDIAVASNEQSSGIAQVNQGIMQVSEVIQTNSATSEESAAASEELSSQAELLKEQIARFNLRKTSNKSLHSYKENDELTPEILRMLEQMKSKKISPFEADNSNKSSNMSTKNKIALSDTEFGKY